MQVAVQGTFAEHPYFDIGEDTMDSSSIWAQDPGLVSLIRQNGWHIDCILLTHGHFDHMGASGDLVQELEMPVCAYESSAEYLCDPELCLSLPASGQAMTVQNFIPGHDGDTICSGHAV